MLIPPIKVPLFVLSLRKIVCIICYFALRFQTKVTEIKYTLLSLQKQRQ
ncbi:hypothetical protein HMPREF0027_2017 [Actinobacillus ureae ATCC 25976]|uniref:Uncharacterized protein n=1 Tax=Actinobacillus ureae ATCC 25976 TaxID=887324 RepID=E8KJK0_9PAST|nr:hypothetical protein HMPREF0027_2017 [Actinobacillus ureae ATCC 25976]